MLCNTNYYSQTISNGIDLSIKKHAIKRICIYLLHSSCLHARWWTIKPICCKWDLHLKNYCKHTVTPISISTSLCPPYYTLDHFPWKLIMRAIISHNVFHPRFKCIRIQILFSISRADHCADASIARKGSSACCALKEKRKTAHIICV